MKRLIIPVISKNKTLSILFVIGIFLRMLNPNFGSPVLYVVPDEASTHLSALNMMVNRTLISKGSQYPPLNGYLQIPFLAVSFIIFYISKGFSSIEELKFFILTHEGYFLFVPRIIYGLFGVFNILLIYKLALQLFPNNKKVAILASLLFTFSLLNIEISHYSRPWSPALFFFTLSVVYSIKSSKIPGSLINHVLSSIFVSITTGFLQLGFFAFCFYLLINLIAYRFKLLTLLKNKAFILGLLIILICSYLFSSLTDFKPSLDFFTNIPNGRNDLLNMILYIFRHNSLLKILKQFLLTEPVIAAFTVLYLLTLKKNNQIIKGIIIFSVFYLFFITFITYGAIRYLSVLVVLLSPLSASMIIFLIERTKHTYTKIFILYICFIFVASPGIIWNSRFFNKPTFIQAREFINENIDSEKSIGANSVRYLGFTPSIRTIKAVQEYDKDFYKTLGINLNEDVTYDNNRNIIYLEKVTDVKNINEIKKAIVKYKINYLLYLYNKNDTDLMASLVELKPVIIRRYSPNDNLKDNVDIANVNLTDITIPELLKINRAGPYIEIINLTAI